MLSLPVPSVQVRWVIWFKGTFGAKLAGVQYGTCCLVSVVVHDGSGTGTVRPFMSAQIVAVAVPLVLICELVFANEVMSSRSDAGCWATVRTSAKLATDDGSAPVPSNIGRNCCCPPRVSSKNPEM